MKDQDIIIEEEKDERQDYSDRNRVKSQGDHNENVAIISNYSTYEPNNGKLQKNRLLSAGANSLSGLKRGNLGFRNLDIQSKNSIQGFRKQKQGSELELQIQRPITAKNPGTLPMNRISYKNSPWDLKIGVGHPYQSNSAVVSTTHNKKIRKGFLEPNVQSVSSLSQHHVGLNGLRDIKMQNQQRYRIKTSKGDRASKHRRKYNMLIQESGPLQNQMLSNDGSKKTTSVNINIDQRTLNVNGKPEEPT